MMPADYDDGRDDGWYMREVARTVQRQRMAVERIVAAIVECCDYCGCALHRSGILVAGGSAVTLTTCPRCDRYDERTDA